MSATANPVRIAVLRFGESSDHVFFPSSQHNDRMSNSKGIPKTRNRFFAAQRNIRDEVGMKTLASVRGTSRRFVQIELESRRIEGIEQSSVVKYKSLATPLRVSGDLSLAENYVRNPVHAYRLVMTTKYGNQGIQNRAV